MGSDGWAGFFNRTSSFLPADVSDILPFATVGSCVTLRWQSMTGPSPGQPAVHPLSRLDRPVVTHSAVEPLAQGFET